MFIYNLKINKKTILFFVVLLAIIIGLFFEISSLSSKGVPNLTTEDVDIVMDTENFIKETKHIHENLDECVDKKIKISGFIFRMPDFNSNIFVCGRNVLVKGEDKIAGVLCFLENNSSYLEDEWVEIYGKITKGEYNNKEMPILKIEKINKIAAPQNTYVELLN